MDSLHRSIPFCPPPPEPISGRFAEVLRPLPKQFDTYEQQFVYRHLDLAGMTTDQLRAEELAVAARIAYETRCDPWFIDRLSRVRALVAQTQGAQR
jgi:hypothetical protein